MDATLGTRDSVQSSKGAFETTSYRASRGLNKNHQNQGHKGSIFFSTKDKLQRKVGLKTAKSNAVVIMKKKQTLGSFGDQESACLIIAEKLMFSDRFFLFASRLGFMMMSRVRNKPTSQSVKIMLALICYKNTLFLDPVRLPWQKGLHDQF